MAVADVTVIIVNWNSGGLLSKCLSHLRNQIIPPLRVLVVDNGSADESLDCLEDFPEVLLRKLDRNMGFAGGNNLAFAECDTEFIALLNPDAFPAPDWLEKLLLSALKHPGCAAFGSRQMMDGARGLIDGLGDVYHFSGLVFRQGHGRPLALADLVAREIFSPCAGAALFRRQALIDAGLFDEDFFCYVEDVDLGFRLRLKGYRAMYVPEAVVSHVGSAATGGQHSYFALYHGHRNLVWTYVKNMPGVLFWLFLPMHLVANLISVVVLTMRGQPSAVLRAKRDAFLGLPRMWHKRFGIQQSRTVTCWSILRVLNFRAGR